MVSELISDQCICGQHSPSVDGDPVYFWGLPFEVGFTHSLSWAPAGFLPGPEGQRVLLVAVPDFSTTQTACLVNLRSLACQPISFSGFGEEEEDLEGFSLCS